MSEALGARLRRTDERTALTVITSAFADDPVERWLYPDESYQQQFPAFARALGGKAFDAGTAWCSDDEAAVALWLPPGVTPDDEAVVDALTATVAMAKHEDMYLALEQMEQAHPKDPHWYLAWLAVERSAQGRGLGTTLLRQLPRDGGHLSPACLSGDAEPTNRPPLPTPRIRASRQHLRWQLPAHHLHAATGALAVDRCDSPERILINRHVSRGRYPEALD